MKGSPATASPVTEYGSVPFKFPDKSYNTGGSNSPLRSKLLISRAKLHHHPVPFEEANNHNPPNDCIHKNFGSRNVFFLLLSVAIHNLFEGMNNYKDIVSQLCFDNF